MHKGIYINDFYSNIFDQEQNENELLDWCVSNGFNEIYLYNIGRILSDGKNQQLDTFVQKVRSNYPQIGITFVSAGHTTSFDNIEKYAQTYRLPDGIVSEIEFWNGGKTFEDNYAPWLKRMDELKNNPSDLYPTALIPNLKKRFYIGKIKSSGEQPNIQIARELVNHHDEIFLVNYHSNAYNLSSSISTNAIGNRLRLLAQAGAEMDKIVNLTILFNVYRNSPSPHIWDYFAESGENHPFEDAYTQFLADYNTTDNIPHKEQLNLIGYSIYRYTDASVARG